MDKSPEAFRTISEVADTLDTPAHVLRFWESRFPQIRPVKRAGGRRYYRPADVALLTGIKRLLHEEGLTIRGVQKILREQGVRHVAGLAGMPEADLSRLDSAVALEEAMAERFGTDLPEPLPVAEVETAQIFALETALRRHLPEPAPAAPAVTPDLFDLLAVPVTPPLAAVRPDEVAEAEADRLAPQDGTAPETQATPVHADEAPDVSRAALLRAMPAPLPDELRATLLPLHARLVQHRDRLISAAQALGRLG